LLRASTDAEVAKVFNAIDQNAKTPICSNCAPSSTLTTSPHLHGEKHALSNLSTDAGIVIVSTPVDEKTDSSIRFNFDGVLKLTEVSDWQIAKHCSPKISIDPGRSMWFSPVR
jgi:hypothetical protein